MTTPRDAAAADPVPVQQAAGAGPAARTRRAPSPLVGALLALGLVGYLLVALAGALVAVDDGESLPGTTLAGRDVGGLGPTDVRAAVTAAAADRGRGALVLRAADVSRRVDRRALGVTTDVEATTEQVLQAGRQGNVVARLTTSLSARFGGKRDVPLAVTGAGLDQVLDDMARRVRRPPEVGGFSTDVEEGDVAVAARLPRPGRALDRDGSRAAIADVLALTGERTVQLPVDQIDPGVEPEQVRRVTESARQRLSRPLRLQAPSGEELSLAPARLAPLLGSRADGEGKLELTVDEPGLGKVVADAADVIEKAPRSAALDSTAPKVLLEAKEDARFRPRPLAARAVAGSPGLEVDLEAATRAAARALLSGDAPGRLPVRVVPPPVSQGALADVDQVIGSFTTRFECCVPRARNIARMAEIVDGTVVPAGATFSLNGTAGPRTQARGFVADKAIVDGELKDQVGGGVSQFATTLFNAVWFAGLPVLEHKPHRLYISRYPPGREATLDFASIDQVWRNDTKAPVVVRARATGDSVTVALYGSVGAREVISRTGPRTPLAEGAFRIEVDRIVLQDSATLSTDSLSWTYSPPLED